MVQRSQIQTVPRTHLEQLWKRGKSMIEVKEIVKHYGAHTAVDHLSFRVEEGQIYGFLGPNGAGKSTTMNIITGYLASNEGTVIINGHDILEEPEEAKNCIGYLPEQPPLYIDMTVKECLLFAAGLRAVKKDERREMIEQIMEKLDLKDVENRLVKNLSKGYKQRVGMAQALMGNPEILILDEPTVGLDPKQIIEIRSLIKELSKEHTIILSSHILSEVSAICDQILIISHGRLAACDTPENLSRKMQGTTALELSIRDPEGRVEDLLKDHFAEQATVEGSCQNGIWDGMLQVKGEVDVREELFYLLAEQKCPLLKMKQDKLSLEDIFLELTDEEPEQKEENRLETNMEETETTDIENVDATDGKEEEHESDL